MTVRLVLFEGEARDVDRLVQQFFARPEHTNGVTTHVIEQQHATDQALIPAPEVVQIRQKMPLDINDDPTYVLHSANVREDWTQADVERMWHEVNTVSRKGLLEIARHSPDLCTYEAVQHSVGFSGTTAGSIFISYGQWCRRNKKRDMLFRKPMGKNPSEKFYLLPPFAAEWILTCWQQPALTEAQHD